MKKNAYFCFLLSFLLKKTNDNNEIAYKLKFAKYARYVLIPNELLLAVASPVDISGAPYDPISPDKEKVRKSRINIEMLNRIPRDFMLILEKFIEYLSLSRLNKR